MVFLMGLVCSAVAMSIETKEYQEADREAAPPAACDHFGHLGHSTAQLMRLYERWCKISIPRCPKKTAEEEEKDRVPGERKLRR